MEFATEKLLRKYCYEISYGKIVMEFAMEKLLRNLLRKHCNGICYGKIVIDFATKMLWNSIYNGIYVVETVIAKLLRNYNSVAKQFASRNKVTESN